MRKFLAKVMMIFGIVWALLMFIAFIAMWLYNTWSPGCAFACLGDSDPFEANLILTWFAGAIICAALLAIANVLDDE